MTPIKSKTYTPAVEAELRGLWDSMRITAPGRFERPLSLARNGRSYYEQAVGRIAPRMPWWVLACIHGLGSNFDFSRHLHNGDSLRWRTRNVPAGRPLAALADRYANATARPNADRLAQIGGYVGGMARADRTAEETAKATRDTAKNTERIAKAITTPTQKGELTF